MKAKHTQAKHRNMQARQNGRKPAQSLPAMQAKAPRKIVNKYIQNPGWPVFSGYNVHGASPDPDLNFFAISGSPRYDIDYALPILRARCRDLYISSTLISSAINTRCAGTIGAGLRLDAQPDASALGLSAEMASMYDRRIETAFNAWARRCGQDGASLGEILQSVEMACLCSGDCFVEAKVNAALQMRIGLIEGDRVDSPSSMMMDENVVAGVRLSSTGRAIAYYVSDLAQFEPGGLTYYTRKPAFISGYYDTMDAVYRLPQSGLLHAHMPFERPGQVRGLPIASKVLTDSKQLERYKAAEVEAAAVAANAALLVTHPIESMIGEDDAMDSFTSCAKSFGEAQENGAKPCDEPCPQSEITHPPLLLKPGACLHLEPGSDVRTFNPGRPNQNFPMFCDAMDSRIASALGLPLEVVQRKYESSYSASRAARLDADSTYRLDRARIIEQVLRPIYNAWLDLNAQRLELTGYYTSWEAREAWRRADFLGESLPSIDPEKEVRAALLAINGGISTRAREARLLSGMDEQTIIRVLAQEEAEMRRYGLVKDQNGNPIAPISAETAEG